MKNMLTKVLIGGAAMAFSLHAAAQTTITGAGATFPFPIF